MKAEHVIIYTLSSDSILTADEIIICAPKNALYNSCRSFSRLKLGDRKK